MPRLGLAFLCAAPSYLVPMPVLAQQRLYQAASSDIMHCPGQGPIGRQLLEREPGHFGCGVSEGMITPPFSAKYAPISETRSVVGEPRVQLFCPKDPRARNSDREAGAVVILDRPFVPQGRPDVANTLIRDAMRLLYAKCPLRPLGTPSMGFVKIAAPGTPGGPPAPLGEVRSYGLGIWFFKTWDQTAPQMLAPRRSSPAPPTSAANAQTPWVNVRTVEPRPTPAERGGVRGRLAIEAQGRSSFTLLAYSNGTGDGLTDLTLAPHQCTQLIVRYAQGLGLANIRTTRDVGDGKDVARNFQAKSGDRFTFQDGAGSSVAPRPGAVISVGATAVDGKPWRGNSYGHVGIAQAVHYVGENAIEVILFDQNFPLPSVQWKRLSFSRSGGNWTGTMTNSVNGFSQTFRVSGWANPR